MYHDHSDSQSICHCRSKQLVCCFVTGDSTFCTLTNEPEASILISLAPSQASILTSLEQCFYFHNEMKYFSDTLSLSTYLLIIIVLNCPVDQNGMSAKPRKTLILRHARHQSVPVLHHSRHAHSPALWIRYLVTQGAHIDGLDASVHGFDTNRYGDIEH